jgi:nucleoid DNA-binding protein
MNKHDLAVKVSKITQKPMAVVEPIVGCLFDTMAAAILEGEKVTVCALGSFFLKTHKPRMGYDPYRRTPIPIPEGKSVRFEPSPAMRRSIRARYAKPVCEQFHPGKIEVEEKIPVEA